jgi:hypothetical protein
MIAKEKALELVEKFKPYSDKGAKPSMLSIGGQRGINYNFRTQI